MARRIFPALVTLCIASSAYAWGGGAPDWLKTLARAPLPSYDEKVRGVALLDEITTTVTDAGEIRTVHRRVFKILNTDGRDLGYAAVAFDQEMRLNALRGWSVTAKGEEFHVKERDAVETAVVDGSLYADTRLKMIRIPASEPGNVVAYEYERLERPYGLQAIWQFQEDIPVRVARYVLNLPPGWSYESRWINAPQKEPARAGGQLVWELSDIGAVTAEPGMPALQSVAGRMVINFLPPGDTHRSQMHRSWSEVGRWYSNLAARRRDSTPGIRAKSNELTQGLKAIERIRALAAFGQRDIRYVAIEIGIGGYQPHAAGDVFANRYGDCKDKVTLLSAMLAEAGVESFYVLVNSTRGAVDKDFASIQSFDHVIIAVRLPKDADVSSMPAAIDHPKLGRLVIFDPTNSTIAFGELPINLQQSRGLLVSDSDPELIVLPGQQAEGARLDLVGRLKLDPAGTLEGDIREVRSGWLAAVRRDTLHTLTEQQRRQYLEKLISLSLNQFSVTDIAVENLDENSKALVISYKLSAPNYARRAGQMLLVRPRVLGRKADAIVELKDRKYAYEMAGPSIEADDIEIVVPPALTVDELPAAQKVSAPALSYSSETRLDGTVLRYRREYKVTGYSVPVEKLRELNRAFALILADERGTAVLKVR